LHLLLAVAAQGVLSPRVEAAALTIDDWGCSPGFRPTLARSLGLSWACRFLPFRRVTTLPSPRLGRRPTTTSSTPKPSVVSWSTSPTLPWAVPTAPPRPRAPRGGQLHDRRTDRDHDGHLLHLRSAAGQHDDWCRLPNPWPRHHAIDYSLHLLRVSVVERRRTGVRHRRRRRQ